MEADLDMKTMALTHQQLVRRIANFPNVTLDVLFKFSLLKLVRQQNDAALYQVVEDKCSQRLYLKSLAEGGPAVRRRR